MARWRRSGTRQFGSGVLLAVVTVLGIGALSGEAVAYTAAGDRIFPATAILPQIAPSDSLYIWGWTTPWQGGGAGMPNRENNIGAVFDKTITERLGIYVEGSWTRLDRRQAPAWTGWENFETELKYRAFDSQPHEFLLSVGLGREWGGTGARRIGASTSGATTPAVYFGKGLRDFDIGYLRPLAVTGFAGYEIPDSGAEANLVKTGFAVEYSIPYLQSKVHAFSLPGLIRGATPLTEVAITTPGGGASHGAHTTVMIAPGVSYAGEGWEFLVEALVPATNATGGGPGVIAQLTLSLDFLFPDTIGRPLFAPRRGGYLLTGSRR